MSPHATWFEFLPGYPALHDALANGRLQRVLPSWQSAEQGIYALYPSHRFIPAKVRAFVDFIEGRLRAR